MIRRIPFLFEGWLSKHERLFDSERCRHHFIRLARAPGRGPSFGAVDTPRDPVVLCYQYFIRDSGSDPLLLAVSGASVPSSGLLRPVKPFHASNDWSNASAAADSTRVIKARVLFLA
jgi:hypothetical protein